MSVIPVRLVASFYEPGFKPKNCVKDYYTFRPVEVAVDIPVTEGAVHEVLRYEPENKIFYSIEGVDGCFVPVAPAEVLQEGFEVWGEVELVHGVLPPRAHLMEQLWGIMLRGNLAPNMFKHESGRVQRDFFGYNKGLYVVPSSTPGGMVSTVEEAEQFLVERASKVRVVGGMVYVQVPVPRVHVKVFDANSGFTRVPPASSDSSDWFPLPVNKLEADVKPVFKYYAQKKVLDSTVRPYASYELVPVSRVADVARQLCAESAGMDKELEVFRGALAEFSKHGHVTDSLLRAVHGTQWSEQGDTSGSTDSSVANSVVCDIADLGFTIVNMGELRRIEGSYSGFVPRPVRLVRQKVQNIVEFLSKNAFAHHSRMFREHNELLDELCLLNSFMGAVFHDDGFQTIETNVTYF